MAVGTGRCQRHLFPGGSWNKIPLYHATQIFSRNHFEIWYEKIPLRIFLRTGTSLPAPPIFFFRKKSIAELEVEMLNGQKLQGPETAAEVNYMLKARVSVNNTTYLRALTGLQYGWTVVPGPWGRLPPVHHSAPYMHWWTPARRLAGLSEESSGTPLEQTLSTWCFQLPHGACLWESLVLWLNHMLIYWTGIYGADIHFTLSVPMWLLHLYECTLYNALPDSLETISPGVVWSKSVVGLESRLYDQNKLEGQKPFQAF